MSWYLVKHKNDFKLIHIQLQRRTEARRVRIW